MILLLLFLVLVVLASFASRVESSKGIKDGPIHKLLGGILIAAGILISGTSGLCSVYIVASGLWNQPNGMEWILLELLLVLIFGGVPFLVGIALFKGGRRMLRKDGDDDASTF